MPLATTTLHLTYYYNRNRNRWLSGTEWGAQHPPPLPPTILHRFVYRLAGKRRRAEAKEYHIKLVSDGCEQLFSYILNEEFNYGQHKFNDKSNDRRHHHRKGCYSRKIAEDHHHHHHHSKCQMKWFFVLFFVFWKAEHHITSTSSHRSHDGHLFIYHSLILKNSGRAPAIQMLLLLEAFNQNSFK